MIVLNEKKNDTNVIHIIIGPETEFQFNLNGQSVIDVTEYIREVPKDEKFVILLNRCDSEEDVLRTLAFEQGKMHFQKAIQDMSNLAHQDKQQVANPSFQHNESPKAPSQNKCPKCGRPGNYKTINNQIQSCESCQQIDNNLAKIKIPPPPDREEMKRLRQQLINDKKKKIKDSGDSEATNG